MAWRAGLTWLVSLSARRRPRRRSKPDHGDMGTALALDASVARESQLGEGAMATSRRPWADRLNRRSSL